MRTSPKRTAERLQRLINAWETLRPTKSFAGMTLEQFKAKVAPSLNARQQLSALREQVVLSRTERHQHDVVANNLVNLVVNAIKGDPDEGEDGALYAALGYVRKSARRSGLTRKGQTTPPPEQAAGK